MLPIITIVGKENVGKSTLFNRIIGSRVAIMDSTPGTTRDRNAKKVVIDDFNFLLVDTGGYLPNDPSTIKNKVKEQVELAINSSTLILFVVDAKTGITSIDLEITEFLRKLNKQILLVINKVDNNKRIPEVAEFHKLGFKSSIEICATQGTGVSGLMDKITEYIDKSPSSADTRLPTFAIIGKPNVGKSTYINALLDEKRVIVDEHPGTTVDTIDVTMKYEDKEFVLVDTPGLRRRTKFDSQIEYYSSVRTDASILKCDVAILFIDASDQISHQDKRIINTVLEYGKGIVIAANKKDLGIGFSEKTLNYTKFVPITYLSALNKTDLYEPLKTALTVAENCRLKLTRKQLRAFTLALKLIKVSQVDVAPPTFAIRIISKNKKLTNYKTRKTLEIQFRKEFGFIGTPIKITII
ncbi:MAG: ribosome biogenesis GTPase Der [bacterium]